MWFYKCFSFGNVILLVLVLGVDNMKAHKNNKKESNVELKIFKNITEANKTLQELIKNFKQLEKVYKNHETTENDSSESEIDKLFRITHNKRKNKNRLRKQTFTTNDPRYNYRGTAFIYEYQESGVIGSEEAKDEKEELVNSKEENTSQESALENDTKTKINSEKISGSDEIEPKTEPDEVVEIKIDTAKKHESLAFKPKKSLIKNEPESYPHSMGKTRFSVLHSGKDNNNAISNESRMPFKIGNQRIVYSEQFLPETIWHEIIHRPIKLNRVFTSEEISISNSRENKQNSDIIIGSKTMKEETTKRLDDPETPELTINAKDGHSIYRTGYGDVCIQVPVKKCKKAAKTVNKNVCKRRFKCESDFKSDFDENSKKECEKKFSYNQSVNKEVNYNISRDKKDDNQFLDATRYRHPQRSIFSNKSDLSLPNNSQNSSIQLSLRDKYEKKCQKESKDKCIAACNDATEKTCLKHTCNAKKKKALTKACKEECKNIFVIDKKSSDESDSSSSSGSESD